MKKSIKLFVILLIAGAVGLTVTLSVAVGAGVLISREASRTYEFDGMPTAIKLDLQQARIEPAPADECRVEAFVKAWRADDIDMDDVLAVRMAGGVLEIAEQPFPSDFLGYFPQPYEMSITIYAPQAAWDAMGGDAE
jgi:hypothetical protein